jgi:uncharacterized membrane protein
MESLSGIHHFYMGIVLTLLGFGLLWAPRNWMAVAGIVICVLGLIIAADDIFQHAMERFYKAGYDTPLKKVYQTCGQVCPLIGKVTVFFDDLFRGKNPLR